MTNKRFRAITTRYKGYAFRSRLEARWAVFFDHLNIRWDYEPEGFELGNGLRYLPDFWLPDWKIWVEIKPTAPDDVASEKASRLAEQKRDFVLVASGLPGGLCTLYAPRSESAGCISEHAAWMPWGEEAVGYIQEPAPMMHSAGGMTFYPMQRLDTVLYGPAEDAMLSARSAQFEYGARGAV